MELKPLLEAVKITTLAATSSVAIFWLGYTALRSIEPSKMYQPTAQDYQQCEQGLDSALERFNQSMGEFSGISDSELSNRTNSYRHVISHWRADNFYNSLGAVVGNDTPAPKYPSMPVLEQPRDCKVNYVSIDDIQ